MKLPPSKANAVTLMEIILASAILAVLVLLVVTVSGRVRTQSEVTACINRLRQIGLAQIAWSNDSNGFFVPNRDDRRGIVFWTQALLPYLGHPPAKWPDVPDVDSFWCPAARGPLPEDPLGYTSSNGVQRSSYSQNISLGGLEPGQTTPRRHRAAVQKPSRMVLVTEGRFLSAASWSIDTPDGPHGALYRHSQKAHLLFVDGHVEASSFPISPAQGNTRFNWEVGAELR